MIALYHYRHDQDLNGVVYSFEELHKATFAPLPCDVLILDGTRKAKATYKERKAKIEEQAIEYSYMRSVVTNMYWSDHANLTEYFERYGKRFGLLKEFRENGIC